jgi:hypothetical protein
MDRGASASVVAQLGAAANEPCHLFELYLDDQTVRTTDAYRNLVWGGNTYVGAGSLLGFDGIEESATLQVTTARVQLTGVLQDSISLLLSHNYIDRRVVIYKAFIHGAGVVVDPIPIFDGRADSPMIEENPEAGTCTVTLAAAQHWIDFERLPGRHTNNAEQQIWFPGDKGFEFVSSLNQQIKWGAA